MKIIILLLVFLISISSCKLRYFEKESVRVVDKIGDNFLFRSGSILTKDYTTVDYYKLLNTMEKMTYELPQNFILIDLNLLNSNKLDDEMALKIETMFFRHNSDKGILINYPIFGEPLSPFNISIANKMAKDIMHWSHDKLPLIVDQIRNLLLKDENLIILVHCMKGIDRTGEVIGAYQMTYLNYTIYDVIRQDTIYNKNKPAPKILNYNSLMWYDLYLKNKIFK